jgi:hypothetical protein
MHWDAAKVQIALAADKYRDSISYDDISQACAMIR